MVFRKTNSEKGRHLAVTPRNSMMRHLSYGRIILDAAQPSVSFNNGDQETGLICLAGKAMVKTAAQQIEIGQFDAIYIPRDSPIELSTSSSVDLAEFSSDVTGKYPLKVVRYADVMKDPGLKFVAGGPGFSRDLCILMATNVEAGPAVAGFSYSDPAITPRCIAHTHARRLGEENHHSAT